MISFILCLLMPLEAQISPFTDITEEICQYDSESQINAPTDVIDEVCIYTDGELEGTINDPQLTYAGTYELTAYTATGNRCADGSYPQTNYTAASNDPKLWHKWIYVEGVGDVYVHDTGGMPSYVIDIYMGSYSECIQFGRRSGEVYIYE